MKILNKGISLIEILIVLAIISILVAVVLPRFSEMREYQVFESAVSDVVSTINKARSQSVSSVNSSTYGVHFESDRVIIFAGTVYNSSDPTNEITEIFEPAVISTIELADAGADVYFSRITGDPSTTGKINISTSNFTKSVSINGTGLVSID